MTTVPTTKPTKVFIVGAPRSGTSILVFAMKDVFGLPGFGESHVMPAFQRMVHHLRAYLRSFADNRDVVMLKKLSRPELEEYLFAYIREFYAKIFPSGSWVDKTPTSEAVFGLPLVEAIFPDAHLIATRRNGIEVVTSYMKKFNSNFEDACLSWLNAMKGLVHARSGCRNLLEVDQYDFVNATDEVSRRIAEHLGLRDRAEALAKYLSAKRVEQSSALDPKAKPRLADTDWTDEQKSYFKEQCGDMMKFMDYEM